MVLCDEATGREEVIHLPLLNTESGCKVGWAVYDNEAEATERSKQEAVARERMFGQGYDFGYQWPGSVNHVPEHKKYGECWIVTTT